MATFGSNNKSSCTKSAGNADEINHADPVADEVAPKWKACLDGIVNLIFVTSTDTNEKSTQDRPRNVGSEPRNTFLNIGGSVPRHVALHEDAVGAVLLEACRSNGRPKQEESDDDVVRPNQTCCWIVVRKLSKRKSGTNEQLSRRMDPMGEHVLLAQVRCLNTNVEPNSAFAMAGEDGSNQVHPRNAGETAKYMLSGTEVLGSE